MISVLFSRTLTSLVVKCAASAIARSIKASIKIQQKVSEKISQKPVRKFMNQSLHNVNMFNVTKQKLFVVVIRICEKLFEEKLSNQLKLDFLTG